MNGRDVVQKAPVNMSTDKRFNEWMYHARLFKPDLRDSQPNFASFLSQLLYPRVVRTNCSFSVFVC